MESISYLCTNMYHWNTYNNQLTQNCTITIDDNNFFFKSYQIGTLIMAMYDPSFHAIPLKYFCDDSMLIPLEYLKCCRVLFGTDKYNMDMMVYESLMVYDGLC